MIEKAAGETLPDYLDNKIFAGQTGSTIEPKAEDVEGFDRYLVSYKGVIPAEKKAVEGFR